MKAKDDRFTIVSIWVERIRGSLKVALLLCVGAIGLMMYVPSTFAAAAAEQKDEAALMKTATYVGTETCVTCHEKQGREFKLSTHARISNDKAVGAAQGCEMCHGPGSVHADASGGKTNIVNPRKNPEICFSCHLEKKMEFRLPYHHPVLEGKMSCSDCHDAHGEEVLPWSGTSTKDMNETCFKCHKDQRGPFVYEHEALRDGCSTCHKVHGSINNKMLKVRDANLCLRCHTQTNFANIGNASHQSGRLTQGNCFSGGCHTAVHGSNFDPHFRY